MPRDSESEPAQPGIAPRSEETGDRPPRPLPNPGSSSRRFEDGWRVLAVICELRIM
jgi:hypothetical protein